jgi:dTDP-4-amino-4,6-dideoxygalactose transaminase
LVCDIDPETLALDHEDMDRRADGALRAVVLVHPYGLAAPVEPFRNRGLLVIEDCAQALGTVDRGRPVGSRGDAAVFSFAPTKVITCGGPGGAVAAPQAAVVAAARNTATHDEKDDDALRLNGLMGDLHAAIATVQLERLREFRDRRAAIAARYDEALAPLPFDRVEARPDTQPMVYRYLLRVPGSEELLTHLNDRGVMARRPVYVPLHHLLGLRSPFPATERVHSELVSLPISPALIEEEVDRVIEEVRRWRS